MTYLILNILTVSYPLFKSFEQKVNMVSKWPAMLPAIAITAAFFIAWDAWFTNMGVWGFNDSHLIGLKLLDLPIEEWLFFITVPYACLFIYEVLIYLVKKDVLGPVARPISMVLALLLLLVGAWHHDRWYTSVTFLLTAVWLAFVIWKRPAWLGRFYLGYAVSLLPFLLMNGVLTGSFLAEPVVWYNDTENLSLRIGTIPIEDSIYMMLLLLMNTTFYEGLKAKRP
ncbi:MAG: lycopene cyclase domain-containing protein [Flavobacteriales bacterium]|nr:lycopene cyclase domain-containing protein [Flavobacteriales bacterium]